MFPLYWNQKYFWSSTLHSLLFIAWKSGFDLKGNANSITIEKVQSLPRPLLISWLPFEGWACEIRSSWSLASMRSGKTVVCVLSLFLILVMFVCVLLESWVFRVQDVFQSLLKTLLVPLGSLLFSLLWFTVFASSPPLLYQAIIYSSLHAPLIICSRCPYSYRWLWRRGPPYKQRLAPWRRSWVAPWTPPPAPSLARSCCYCRARWNSFRRRITGTNCCTYM